MTWVAVAVGAGTVVSGYLGSQSSKKASKAAQAGSAEAIAEARRQFDLVRGDTAGQRALGDNAINALSRLYGYGPPPTMQTGVPSGASRLSAPSGGGNSGGLFGGGTVGALLAPTPKNFIIGNLDPVRGIGNALGLFGSKKGDEKRNLKAFLGENKVYDIGNGMLALEDGTQFPKDQLEHIAGTWYGATYAPDGDQQGWQQRYESAIAPYRPQQSAAAQPTGATAAGPAQPSGPDMSVFFESPDYQFRLSEGQKALDRMSAAGGRFNSGGAAREGIRYASNLASGEWGAFVDRLMQQAGLGSTGIGASAAAGAQTANNVGSAAINAGNARASSYLQSGQALNNSIQGGISNVLLARYLGG